MQFLVQYDRIGTAQRTRWHGGKFFDEHIVYPLRFFYQIYLPLLASSRSLAAFRSSSDMGLMRSSRCILIGPCRPLLVSQSVYRTGSYCEPSHRDCPYTDPYLVTLYYYVIVADLELCLWLCVLYSFSIDYACLLTSCVSLLRRGKEGEGVCSTQN